MNDSPLKDYGFVFTLDGAEYSFSISAESKDAAMRQLVAMKDAELVGELHEAPNAVLSRAAGNPDLPTD